MKRLRPPSRPKPCGTCVWPRLRAAVLTRWPLANVLAEPLAIYLDQLSDGALPGRSLRTAKRIESFTNTITSRSKIRRDIEASFAGPFANQTAGQAQDLTDRVAA